MKLVGPHKNDYTTAIYCDVLHCSSSIYMHSPVLLNTFVLTTCAEKLISERVQSFYFRTCTFVLRYTIYIIAGFVVFIFHTLVKKHYGHVDTEATSTRILQFFRRVKMARQVLKSFFLAQTMGSIMFYIFCIVFQIHIPR